METGLLTEDELKAMEKRHAGNPTMATLIYRYAKGQGFHFVDSLIHEREEQERRMESVGYVASLFIRNHYQRGNKALGTLQRLFEPVFSGVVDGVVEEEQTTS